MNLGIIVVGLFFGGPLFYLLVGTPSSDLVFSAAREADVHRVKAFLDSQGIRTYLKNDGIRRLHSPVLQSSDMVDPSLHVVDPQDRRAAIRLIRELNRK